MRGSPDIAAWCMGFLLFGMLAAAMETTQRQEDFTSDPGWEGRANRVDSSVMQAVTQDFGYSRTNHAGGKIPGEIGGRISRSLTPAIYSKKISIRTLEDKLTASGKFAVTEAEGNSGVLIGWFNNASRGWRTPNSLAIRLDGNGPTYWVFFEYGTQNLRTGSGNTFEGGSYQTTKTSPEAADGTIHTWSLTYDPEKADGNGEMTFVMDGKACSTPLRPEHKEDGAVFDRFGIFNQQISGESMITYFSHLSIDGEKQDLSSEPEWEGEGNRVTFEDRAIRPYHNFGFSPTSHAGGRSGEMGGLIWRIDADKPERSGYYADKVGTLTMNHELKAEGKIAMTRAAADSAVLIGWFNSQTHIGAPPKNFVGIMVEGPSRVGHYFRPLCSNSQGDSQVMENGPIIQPNGKQHNWMLHYDPDANNDRGKIQVTFDDEAVSLDLNLGIREDEAVFDRFGMLSYQRGGHYVDIYIDDISYTAQKQ